MNAEFIQGFLAQAENCLPMIRSGILVSAQTGNRFGELNASLRQTTAIKDAASIVRLEEAAEIAAHLEGQLRVFAPLKVALTDVQSRGLLDKLTELEVVLARINFNCEDFSAPVNEFVEQSFENLGLHEPRLAAPTEPPDEWAETFEIDAEMLEIFGEEAEELISGMRAKLQILEKNPHDGEALLEIRRAAHTLKGSAGIVGLKMLSETAHRVEDLLDFVAENNVEADAEILEILRFAAECFGALAANDNSPALLKKINQLSENFDVVAATLRARHDAAKKSAIVNSQTAVINQFLPADYAARRDLPTVGDTESMPNNRSVVRVSLEKLDELVKIMSGLVLSRSVFEQRLAELEQQTGELRNSTRRLQHTGSRIEADFEAEMLDTGNQHSANGGASLDQPKSFDALELDRYTEFHQTMRELIETTGDTAAINGELDGLKNNLESLFDTQSHLIEEMQDKLLRLRMVSFGSLAVRLQRTVRVTADEEGKAAELLIEGGDLEVDTQILDGLIEPLLHLLRNAVAHGIEPPETRRLLGKPETGRIVVRAADEGTHIILTVSDDGRGISAAALKAKAVESGKITDSEAAEMSEQEAFALVFLVGMTTAESISQISGRGVGMNVVKTAVARQQGTVSIASESHQGATFTVRLPMRMTVTRALIVKAGDETFAFPLKFVKQIKRRAPVVNFDAETEIHESAFVNLNDLLALPRRAPNEDHALLLIKTPENPCVLLVDEIVKTEEIIVKPFGSPLHNLPDFFGAAILGDGSVVPVLDLIYLLQQKKSTPPNGSRTARREPPSAANETRREPGKLTIMIVDDSPSVRHLTSNFVENAGWTWLIAKDGLEALEVLQNARRLPDVILSDVEMPRMNGYELLAALKKQARLQLIPVVMITSRAGEKHHRKAFDSGAAEYLTKPFNEAALIETIKTLTATEF